MAFTIVAKRLHESYSQREVRSFIQYTITGTYATGGFATPFTGVIGTPGANAVQSKTPVFVDWQSPAGYIYGSTITVGIGNAPATINTKIYSAPGTELANGAAAPDAVVVAAIDAQRY